MDSCAHESRDLVLEITTTQPESGIGSRVTDEIPRPTVRSQCVFTSFYLGQTTQ